MKSLIRKIACCKPVAQCCAKISEITSGCHD